MKRPREDFAVENEVFRRYNQSLQYAVPWVDRAAPLCGLRVLEIGCGSGSSTAAFAPLVDSIFSYDIEPHLVRATEVRAGVLGLTNIIARVIAPERPLDELESLHFDGVDMVLLFAVLEHCTSEECLGTLRTAWRLLRPGGHLVVVESPNRLDYLDYHTSQLPFFHLLPRPIALRYYAHSPRSEVVAALDHAAKEGEEKLSLMLTRLGIGISYHEFQLGLEEMNLEKILVADGYEPEMVAWFPIHVEERLLRTFFQHYSVAAPIGFARSVLNLIFRKPDGSAADDLRIDQASRLDVTTNYAERTIGLDRNQAALYQTLGESTAVRWMSGRQARLLNFIK